MNHTIIILCQIIMFTFFISCKKSLNGNVVTFFNDGDTSTVYCYKKDVLDGPFKEFYDNGKIKVQGSYNNGLQNGVFEIYYPNGYLSKYYLFQKDTLMYAKRFTEDGKLIDWVIGFKKTNEMFKTQLFYGEPLIIGYTLPYSMADAYLSLVLIDLSNNRRDTLATFASESKSINYEFMDYKIGNNQIEVTVCEMDKITNILLGCQRDTLQFEVLPAN